MPKPITKIEMVGTPVAGGEISFKVTPMEREKNPYLLWVANKLRDITGEIGSAQYLPVVYEVAGQPGEAGPFTLDMPAGYQGVAYVWRFPASEKALPGTLTAYLIA